MTFSFDAINPERSIVFLPFDGQHSQDVGGTPTQVCRSLSKVPGSLDYARMGNGTTSSTFPTQLAPRGVYLDGGDYVDLDWTVGSPLDSTSFTFLLYGRVKPSDMGTYDRLYEIGIVHQRYALYWDKSAGVLEFFVDDLVNTFLRSSKGYPDSQDHVYAVSIDRNACRMYCDGEVIDSIEGDYRLPSFDPATLATIGAYPPLPTANSFKGEMYQAAIYPFALNSVQVREWGRRARQARTI